MLSSKKTRKQQTSAGRRNSTVGVLEPDYPISESRQLLTNPVRLLEAFRAKSLVLNHAGAIAHMYMMDSHGSEPCLTLNCM